MRCKYCGSEINDRSTVCPVCNHELIDQKDSDSIWFYADGETFVGPYSGIEMDAFYNSGKISDSTYIWRNGLDQWVTYEQSEIYPGTDFSATNRTMQFYGDNQSTEHIIQNYNVSNNESANWYYNDASRDLGPFYENELINLYDKRIINDSTIIWNTADNIKTSFRQSSIFSKVKPINNTTPNNVQTTEYKVNNNIQRNTVNKTKSVQQKSFMTALISIIAVFAVLLIVLVFRSSTNSSYDENSDSDTVAYAAVDEDNDGFTYILNDGVPGETIFEDRIYNNISDERELLNFTPTRDGYVFSYWDRSTNFDSNTVILSAVWTYDASSSGYYLIPDSSTRYISTSDLNGFNYDDCQLAINEIYARHGRKFTTPSIQAYFNAQSWYTPTIEAKDFNDSMLTSLELVNVNTIVKYEKSKGWR